MRIMRLSLVVFCLLMASRAYSQSNYASLSGTVFDPQQKVLAGSSVQLTSENTGASRSAVTNELGSFQITGLLPGDYKVSVQASGFAALTQKITLEVGQSMTLDLNLRVASLYNVVVGTADSINVLRTKDA
jgi:hypothetical protein